MDDTSRMSINQKIVHQVIVDVRGLWVVAGFVLQVAWTSQVQVKHAHTVKAENEFHGNYFISLPLLMH